MRFPHPLTPGTLIRRYMRFLAEVRLEDGSIVTAHCANTGSMLQVKEPGSPVLLSPAANPDRRTRWNWELIKVNGLWAGINTAVPNILLKEGFLTGAFPGVEKFDSITMEVKYGTHSRADAVLSSSDGKLMYIEAKNVTLVENGRALFPDAVTERGAKHLDELMAVISQGHRAAMFFLSQRMDADELGVAEHIDPSYAARIREAIDAGVEIMAWRARITPGEITLDRPLPFVL